ncbi:hypothetical protein ACEN9H_25130 [Massilia cellulosiltytica]|jgi:hypothetical protein|uniref:hypothetical protein n=1 Tax=Massilia cellulosiltytica TaxID=2683234 RepID=UPI0039B4310D
MNAALQDFRLIWRAAAAQREAQAVRTLGLALGAVGLCAAVFIVGGVVHGGLQALEGLRLFAGFVTLALALVWTFLFVPGSIRMNSPINAWLLPRQRRRLLQMTTAYWLLATVGMAFGLGLWIALPAVALSVLGLALLSAGNKHVVFLLVVGGNWPWLAHVVLPPAWVDAATGPVAALVLGILVVPIAVWALRWLYPAGGDAFFERRGDQMKRVARFDQCGEDKQPVPEGPTAVGNLPFYFVALRCDLKRANPAAMLMHALGPAAHWSAWVGGLVTLLFMGGIARLLLKWSHETGAQALVDLMTNVGPSLLALTIAFSTAQYSQQIRRTQGEQALLRLTPLAGDAALLNRRLAGRVLRQGLGCWAALTVAMVAVLLLIDAGPDALLRQLGLCSLAGQVAMMGLLGDYASGAGGWNLMLGLRAGALAVMQALAAVGLAWITGTTAWPWLIEISLAVCLVQLRLDWRRMLAAPPAFPAGRLG